MKKGQRPSSHSRNVKTRYGHRLRNINPHIKKKTKRSMALIPSKKTKELFDIKKDILKSKERKTRKPITKFMWNPETEELVAGMGYHTEILDKEEKPQRDYDKFVKAVYDPKEDRVFIKKFLNRGDRGTISEEDEEMESINKQLQLTEELKGRGVSEDKISISRQGRFRRLM